MAIEGETEKNKKYQFIKGIYSESWAVDANLVIAVYDIQGRLVAYLDRGLKSAGYYEAEWNADNNASGIYFIRMNVLNSNDRL